MQHSNNHCDFHLERVHEVQVVFCDCPSWIQPKRVDTVLHPRDWISRLHSFYLIARSEKIETGGKIIIVDKPAEGCKESHKCKHVAMRKKHAQDGIYDFFLPKGEVNPKGKEDHSVADIPEHDSKEEGEGDYSEKRRIGLLVSCNTVCLYDFLCWSCKIVDHIVGWILFSGCLDNLSSWKLEFPLQLR